MALRATDISFSYGPRFGIDRASLRAEAGEFVGLIGGNGSGKTTLLKLVCGLLRRTGGSVLLDGKPLESYDHGSRAKLMAYVPQSYQPVFEFTVEQTVLLGRMPYNGTYGGFETAEDIRIADEAISLLELESLRHEPVTHLSGGELQRALIARALAQGAKTIVLDEPSAHLDIAHQQSIFAMLRRRMRTQRLCVIASIHDLNLASNFCDSLALISNGKTLGQGTPSQILTGELLQDAFGIDVEVEPNVYGNAPAIRYRYRPEEVSDDH